jgi:arylsulfatase A-like enzyme
VLPNIVFITCHDLGRHLSVYGWDSVPSPQLERIGQRGIVFDNNFCID